jgi:DNA polymerase elongation subunit (family B)
MSTSSPSQTAAPAPAAPAEASDADVALFGKDPMPRIVDVEPMMDRPSGEPARVRLYQRTEDFADIIEHEETFYPFFFLSDASLLNGLSHDFWCRRLEGDNFFRHAAVFPTWSAYWDAVRQIERRTDSEESWPDEIYRVGSPTQQYLMQSGRTCLLDMTLDDLHRLQLDIEVYTEGGFPNADRPEDKIIIVAFSDNRGWTKLLHLDDGVDEATLLRQTVEVIQDRDPDVIEGHNCFSFDLSYILDRCDLHGVDFAIGRDGSVPRTYDSSMRFAERTVDYPAVDIVGRHVIDTYFQVMSFDVFSRDLPDYSLKTAARYFGLAPEERTYIEGVDISKAWREDRETLLDYALDDVIETRRLAGHLSGSTFYLAQMLPMTYGSSARRGPAAKIESLFVREYLRQRHALPRSEWGSQSMGGYTDIFLTGVMGPIVYADVESLYPSIMLNYDVKPSGDSLDLFPQLLERLTDLRLETKQDMKEAEDEEVRSELDARQSSYKVLINCFDPETEVVTVDGIKHVNEIEVGDRVYSLNPDTGEVEIKPVTATQAQHYEGPMVEIKNRHTDFLVTPNHRFLTQKFTSGEYTDLEWETASDMLDDSCRRRLPTLPESPMHDRASTHSDTRGLAKNGKTSAPSRAPTLSLSDAPSPLAPPAPPSTDDQPLLIEAADRRPVDYSGMIYCLTVADNHTVLAGRNRKFNWTGQSFYGVLGFSLSAFNDFEEADRVARTGQELLRELIAEIRERGGTVIEVDTDGVLFVPPDGVRGEQEEIDFTVGLTEAMPEGIRVGFDGRYETMLSYKKKNYALLTYDGNLKFKGSSLISRSNEPFGRDFVRKAIRRLLDHDVAGLHELYVDTRDRIINSDWDSVDSFARTEALKDTLADYEADVEAGNRPRAATYELAKQKQERTGKPVKKGDRISYYITGDSANVTAFKNSKLAADWDPDEPDENTAYYLKRLDEFAEKFEPFFTEEDFRLVFSPEDLFGFSADGIEIQTVEHEADYHDGQDDVPF